MEGMTYNSCKVREAAEKISRGFELLSELGFEKLGKIPGPFFEIWVANELIELGYSPLDVGKSADIRLPNGLEIEVKGSKKYYDKGAGVTRWGYNFRDGKQVINKKFDFCILVRAKDNGTPKDYFILDLLHN